MVERLLIWLVFVLVVLAVCYLRPNAVRIFLGLFFIAMALGIHVVLVAVAPESYIGFGRTALIPLYRWIFLDVVARAPLVFGLLAAAFEIAIALLMLSKPQYARLGLIAGSVFLFAITPLGGESLPNALLAIGLAYLATKEFDSSVLDMLRRNGRELTPGGAT